MAWGWVQDDSFDSDATSASSVNKTFTNAVGASSLLVVLVSCQSTTATITSCTDSLGQTFSSAIGPSVNTNLGFSQWILYYPNSLAGADTITVNFSVSVAYRRIVILEYSGIATTSPVDNATGSTGNSTTPDSGAITTTQANELIFGGAIDQFTTLNADTAAGFTAREAPTTGIMSEDKNGTTAGSYHATFTDTGGAGEWIAQVAAFKQVSAPPPPPTSAILLPQSIM